MMEIVSEVLVAKILLYAGSNIFQIARTKAWLTFIAPTSAGTQFAIMILRKCTYVCHEERVAPLLIFFFLLAKVLSNVIQAR